MTSGTDNTKTDFNTKLLLSQYMHVLYYKRNSIKKEILSKEEGKGTNKQKKDEDEKKKKEDAEKKRKI